MVTMKRYWEVDIRLSKSETNLTVDDLEVKIERSVLTVAPRPMVPVTKNGHHCAISKSAS